MSRPLAALGGTGARVVAVGGGGACALRTRFARNAFRPSSCLSNATALPEPHRVTVRSYVMRCDAYDKTQGIQLLNDAVDLMRDSIKESKGELQVKVAARAVNEHDDKLLSSLMSTLEEQNSEVEGDDDAEDVEGMGNVDIS